MSNHTISFLRRKFAEVGLEPNARHGQNFLIDLNLLDVLIRTAEIDGRDVVLEVGTGTGSLTTRLASLAGHVVTVEIDQHLYELARTQLAGLPNVTPLCQDVLRNKNHLHDNVLQTVRDAMTPARDRFKLVANLPYNVGTCIIANLLAGDPWPTRMTVTIQKELAERMTAAPGTRDYSALSVWVQSLADVTLERVLPPSVFWPRPKVYSAIVNIVPVPDRRRSIPDLVWYQSFIRSLFLHRRKLLRGVLWASYKKQFGKAELDAILAHMSLGEHCRAEQLGVPELLELSELVRNRITSSAG